ncbi:ribosome-binding protein [Kickxella alabastrina]|uniref:Ribosome-binding protein n=1 Tax=Kickxella alabastrina TaxID=61397 RepID=A0ACC1IA87_9FUNG|nr:ribosome-binding protein [Kickxella alabastrina]
MVPTRYKTSEQLISSDIHCGTSNYKFTYAVEIIPICKDDLVAMPKKTANSLGHIAPLALCTRVGNAVHIIDFKTLQTACVTGLVFWRHEDVTPVCSMRDLKEFYVLDVELLGQRHGRYALADITIQRMADVGKNDNEIIVRSHLGNLLNYGDTVLGYDLATANVNNKNFESLNPDDVPAVVLVKKSYPERRRKRKQRNWKLKSLTKDDGDLAPKKQDQDKLEADFETFLRDLEEDPELRQNINLYKDPNTITARPQNAMEESDMEDDGEELPEVPLDELLEDLKISSGSDDDEEMGV